MSNTKDPDTPRTEHRAGEVIAGKVPAEELDPATIAELAAWFGAPAQGFDEPPPRRETHDERERRELWERRRRAMAAVEPELLERLEARTHAGDPFIRLPEPPRLHLENPLNKFDPKAFRIHQFDVGEWEVPEDLRDMMEERAPQAILRDLHRPVLKWSLYLHPQDLGMDIGGARATQAISDAVGTRYQVRMAERPMASQEGRKLLAELRARLREPWDNIEIPEERRTQATSARTAEDMRWFGDIGYDPDL